MNRNIKVLLLLFLASSSSARVFAETTKPYRKQTPQELESVHKREAILDSIAKKRLKPGNLILNYCPGCGQDGKGAFFIFEISVSNVLGWAYGIRAETKDFIMPSSAKSGRPAFSESACMDPNQVEDRFSLAEPISDETAKYLYISEGFTNTFTWMGSDFELEPDATIPQITSLSSQDWEKIRTCFNLMKQGR